MTDQEENRIEAAADWKDRLISSKKYYFNVLKKPMLPGWYGVYAIFLNKTNECLYVGQTKNLRRRLYRQHFNGSRNNSTFRNHLLNDLENSQVNKEADIQTWLESNCYFQYLEIEDHRKRLHVEGLLSFLLNSKYIGKVNN